MTAARFCRRPGVEIEAVQVTWATWSDVVDFLGKALLAENPDGARSITADEASDTCGEPGPAYIAFEVRTVHGELATVRHGDWVIPEKQPGRFYPCKPDVFATAYEPAAPTKPTNPTLAQVHAYLEAHGWERRPDNPPGREHWQHPRRDYENDGLTFPTAEVERDGWDPLGLEFFAIHEGRCEHEVLAEMLGQPDPATLLKRIGELTADLDAARSVVARVVPVMQQLWDVALAQVLPAWRALEPILAPDAETGETS